MCLYVHRATSYHLPTTHVNCNRSTHSEYPERIFVLSLHRLLHSVHRLVERIGLDSLLQPLELSQLEVCFHGLSTATRTGLFLCPHLPQGPRLASKVGNRMCTHSLSHHRCLSCLCLSPCFSLSCPSNPFSSCLSLARCPSVPTSQEPCAAHGRRRISVPVSTPRTYARKVP